MAELAAEQQESIIKKGLKRLSKMDIEKYLDYAETAEARAILFVKKYLDKANNRVWVDIQSCDEIHAPQQKPGYHELHEPMFRYVKCELFPRKTQPKYPPRDTFGHGPGSETAYIYACRAATWEAANHDIAVQKKRKYRGPVYIIQGGIVERQNGKRLFRKGTPPEILALAKNPNDRTDPLWSKAIRYLNVTREFKIFSIKRK